MPELPEVETIARTLAPQVVGKIIADIEVLLPKTLQDDEALLPGVKGARIRCVFRRAKLLLVEVQPDGNAQGAEGKPLLMAFHLKMTGRFFVHPAGTAPGRHTRLIFDLDDGGRLFFDDMRRFGFCRLLRPDDLPKWPFWAQLGPEPLEMLPKELAAHLAAHCKNKRAAIKAVLLDQRVVAGIGNIYADESLFKAGIDPTAPAAAVAPARFLALAEALQAILRLSIEECGSSIRDYRDAAGNAGAFQNSFAVYGRKDAPCVRCGKALQHARIAGRGTVYCPHCQK